jgi:Zn finger protein HypA/HybF involved in hydrogenase expression
MSYYGIHEAKVEYMSCNNCTTEAFAWIAESLPCPKCDSDEYVYPDDVDGM